MKVVLRTTFTWLSVANLASVAAVSSDLSPDLWSTVVNFELPLSNQHVKRRLPTASRFLEFGDFAETPESCPATTTCPLVCVGNVTECPTQCEDPTLTLCADGNCAEECDESLETPCLCDDLPVACPKVVMFYNTCKTEFADYYDADADCQEAQEDAIPQVSFDGPWFVACYTILSVTTFLVWFWCLFNQVLWPVSDSTVGMTSHEESVALDGAAESSEFSATSQGWTQTGYKFHSFGFFVYCLVTLTFTGFQFLLFTLTIFYYMQQESITRWDPVFQDEIQVLKAFEITWMVGFVWCFAFKYIQEGTQTLFWRRCSLKEAQYVAVVAPSKSVNIKAGETAIPTLGDKIFAWVWCPIDMVMRIFFSYRYGRRGETVVFCKVHKDKLTGTSSFYHRMRRYVLSAECESYVPGSMSIGNTFGDFLGQSEGLTSERAKELAGLVGPNIIPLDKPTLWKSLTKEFNKSFYLYQNFMVWTWAPYWYYYMAIVQTFVRLTGGIVVAVINFIGEKNLYRITCVDGQVEVLRDGAFVTIDVKDVVPGDVVRLKPGYVYCDLVVVKGDHILLDESALTGEANAKPKRELDSATKETVFDPKRHSVHEISAGTTITEVGNGDELGLVTKTGSFTTKGELISDVLSYSRHKFKFDDEVKTVIFILILEAIFLCSMAVYFLADQLVYSWFYAVFILGTVIPPLLPTVFVVSVGVSAKRLQDKRITCTYPEGILVAGKVKCAFFDKTGTLTKQGMEFIATESAPDEYRLGVGMAVCHTLKTSSTGSLVGNQVDQATFSSTGSEIMYKSGQDTRVAYEGENLVVLKTFEFDSHRATQSVIVKDGKGQIFAYVKGSPESMRRLCVDDSIPGSFDDTIRNASKTGVYQLAFGFKTLGAGKVDTATIRREDIEDSLTFAGFVNFRNMMQEATPDVIDELLEGDVSCTIVTGDSVYTGIYIAKESGIISKGRRVVVGSKIVDGTIQWTDADTDEVIGLPSIEQTSSQDTDKEEEDIEISKAKSFGAGDSDLALTGEVWAYIRKSNPVLASGIARQTKVFGRCNPSDKVSVITTFVEAGEKTLMVGDGQNDCGALKMAHVGIALSSSEASIVAPFTSLDKTITSASEVLREGRCALASALAAYKYYITYGQVESYLQVINAYLSITFTEWCWVFLDGIWSVTMAFSLPLSKPANRLAPFRPTASLLGPHTMFSICGILGWNFLFICIGLLALYAQDWFQCRKWDSNDVSNVLTIGDNYESSVLFAVGGYQYIASAMALNFGYVFRQGYMKNYVFVFLSTLWSVFQFFMVLYPSGFSCIWRVNCDNEDAVRWVTELEPVAINNPFNTTVMPQEFRWKLFAILVCNLLALVLWEYFVVNGSLMRRAQMKRREREEGRSAAGAVRQSASKDEDFKDEGHPVSEDKDIADA